MEMDWPRIEKEIAANRIEIIDTLGNFALNDVLLFWSSDPKLFAEQNLKWAPVIEWANQMLNARFLSTPGLEIPKENQATMAELKGFINNFSNKELAAFYTAALNMRSVLLALALVKGHLSAKEAYELSELEELYQAKTWGSEPVAEARRKSLKDTLAEVENYLRDERGLS